MQKKQVFVIHHSVDFDGIFCREIARHYFESKPDYAVEYIGWNYGEPAPVVPASVMMLYMLDVSVPELMEHPRLIWIDHHATAIEKHPESIKGYRLDGVAACRLAWQWFAWCGNDACLLPVAANLPRKKDYISRLVREPAAVRLAGEYDVWDKRDPNAELLQHGLRTCEPQYGILLGGNGAYLARLFMDGEKLAFARERENASIIADFGFDVCFEGLRFLACNAPRCNSLLFAAELIPAHDGCLAFRFDGKAGHWTVSLYGVPSKPEIDLSAIAKKYGGGGHKQACGFQCRELPFELPGARAEHAGMEGGAE